MTNNMSLEQTILDIAKKNKVFATKDIFLALKGKYSRQYVSRIINDLVKSGRLVRSGNTKIARYALFSNKEKLGQSVEKKYINKNLDESEVLNAFFERFPFLSHLPDNVRSVFEYGFTEMFNNAIEHSKSKFIETSIIKRDKKIIFIVRDAGIGVFKNIQKKRALKSELSAIQDLLKGKTTTAKKGHSGEGIFFTSKIADVFLLDSFGYRLRIDNKINDVFIESLKPQRKGTKVSFEIATNTRKKLADIFKEYQTGYSFDKTKVNVKLYAQDTAYISRSQARRVLAGLDKFKLIILDFDKVKTIGQAFADEVFRVFKKKHPKITIESVNTNESIDFMLKRVRQ